MKRIVLTLLILVCVFLAPVAAQDNGRAPEFFSFNLGVPLGFDLGVEEFAAGYNFTVSFAILDNFSVGYDFISVENGGAAAREFNSLRLGFLFNQNLGAAVSIGNEGTNSALGLGLFTNLSRSTTAQGIKSSLYMRIDYFATLDDFGDGALLFATGISFGI